VGRVLGFVKGIPARITGALGSLGGLLKTAGRNVIQGLVDGFQEKFEAVKRKLGQLTDLLPEWKGPAAKDKGLLSQAGRNIIGGLVDGLTGSFDRVQSTLGNLTDMIKVTFAGGVERTILDATRKAGRALSGLAEKRDQLFSNFSQVAGGVMSGGALVGLGKDEEGNVTGSGIVAELADKVSAAKNFAANLMKLTQMGLNKQAVAELAQAGAEQGAAAAQALVDAGATMIGQVNALQGQLTSAAVATGKVGSVAMYEAGLETAKGWQQGFASQEKAIEARMLKIARNLQKTFKKALGIRSPSTVFEGIGVNTALGFVNGVESMQGRAQAATGALAGNPGTIAGRARGGAAAGPTTIQLMSPNGQVLIQWLLRAQRDNGGSIPDLLTGTA
jgi:hypothetical protein